MAERPPSPHTPFVGRRHSLARIGSLLREHRLVTLTGVGGAGKTRLALRIADEPDPDLHDEVFWVELASVEDPRLVGPTVCVSLELRPSAGLPPLEALVNRLRAPRALLVLDNCEHVVEASAELVESLLERCPGLRVLATSREALAVAGEVAWPVPSLSVPDPAGTAEELLGSARDAESVELFVDRARAVHPGFGLTASNVAAVVRLCRRLEGIPLALELAAARVRVLTPAQIVERLDEGLGLLESTGRGMQARHRTMRAALTWSHDLLTKPESVLFRRLGVFGGQASMEACEAVCPDDILTKAEILDLLTRLVERSLVVVDGRASTARYRLLEPVRQFAMERLREAGELDPVRRRHAAYYLELARTSAPGLRGSERARSFDRMALEHDDLRRAWDHAVAAGDGRTVAGLVDALFWFWHFGGHFGEGRMRSEEALERLGAGSEARADLLWAAGTLAWMQGDYEVAGARLEACAAGCREGERDDLLPLALREMAGVRLVVGDLVSAAELYEESARLLRKPSQAWDLALALVMLADVRHALGDAAAASGLLEEARALFGRERDAWGSSLAHFGLAVGAAREGDLDGARVHAREALALQRAAGDDWNTGQVLVLLGEVEGRAGHPRRGAELLVESLEAFKQVGDRTSLVHVLLCLVSVERRRGRTLRAVRLAGAGHALADTLGGFYPYALATDDERAEDVERLRRTAGEEAFADEWAAGRCLSLDEAVDFAASGPDPSSTPSREEGLTEADPGRTADLRIFALGPPEVYRGHRRLRPADWTYALPRELLFHFLLHGPRTREQIGLDFWPEASNDQLRGRFRTALYQLRRALGGTEWVRYAQGRYVFERSLDYWFDVEDFTSNLDQATALLTSDPEAAAAHLQRAVDLYRGDFLEGEAPGAWASTHRDDLRRRYLDALITLGGLRAQEGAHAAAAELYRRAVACEELDERAHRELVRSLARAGDRAGALRHLEALAERLARDLDAELSGETAELRARLERGEVV